MSGRVKGWARRRCEGGAMVPWRHWWRPTAGAQQARSKRPDGASQAHGRRAGAGRCAPGKGCGQVDDAPGGAPGAARGQRRRCPPPAPFAHLPTALHDGEKNLQYTADVYNDSTRCASLLFAGASGSYLIWKRLSPSVRLMFRLCDALDITPSDLLQDVERRMLVQAKGRLSPQA